MKIIDSFNDRYGTPMFRMFASVAHARKNQVRQHRHTEFEISFVLSGNGIYKTENGDFEIAKDDIFLFSTNEYHCITDILPIDGKNDMELLNIQFSPSFILENNPPENATYMNIFFRRSDAFSNRLTRNNPHGSEIRHLLFDIREECENKRPCYITAVRNRIADILICILRNYGFADPSIPTTDYRRYNENLQRAVAYINEHFNEAITLDAVVSCAKLTKTHFLAIFRAAYNMTTWDYINIKRIELALRLLLSSDLTILDIATQCGYNNTANFNRIFKKITGNTPREYRKSKRQPS